MSITVRVCGLKSTCYSAFSRYCNLTSLNIHLVSRLCLTSSTWRWMKLKLSETLKVFVYAFSLKQDLMCQCLIVYVCLINSFCHISYLWVDFRQSCVQWWIHLRGEYIVRTLTCVTSTEVRGRPKLLQISRVTPESTVLYSVRRLRSKCERIFAWKLADLDHMTSERTCTAARSHSKGHNHPDRTRKEPQDTLCVCVSVSTNDVCCRFLLAKKTKQTNSKLCGQFINVSKHWRKPEKNMIKRTKYTCGISVPLALHWSVAGADVGGLYTSPSTAVTLHLASAQASPCGQRVATTSVRISQGTDNSHSGAVETSRCSRTNTKLCPSCFY